MGLEKTIAVDAMSAEVGIGAVIEGARLAKERCSSNIILVGQKDKFAGYNLDGLSVHPALEVIRMEEEPFHAVRSKKNASVVVVANLVKKGEADIMLSPGNTGASITAAALYFRRLKGIKRPAIATTFPTMKADKYTIMIDSGANTDITKYAPELLYQFAVMGSEFSRYLFGIDSPEVGLVNVGKESYKGSELIKAADRILRESSLNYAGFVEGGEILTGKIDVFVCDGFTGNVLMKGCEAIAEAIYSTMKEKFAKSILSKIGAQLLKKSGAFDDVKERLSYEAYGGGFVLGLQKPAMVAHGSSNAKAIEGAILFADRCTDISELNQRIKEKL